MVLSFINLENGVTFDGNPPYEFWFDEGQSVNLIYVKRITFLSDTDSEQITVEAGTSFFLLDVQAIKSIPQIHISDDDYFDLASVGSNSIQSEGKQYSVSGKSYNIHSFYICCRNEDAGQFKATFTIGDKEYTIGADFYNEDERLAGNLENLGIEIPESVQKAIYESNVHEEATDNILMNRKWKELLLEYWRIAACKGSYRSLISSMKWFEYGELVKIMEYWKRGDVGRQVIMSNDIEQILSDLFREQLSVLSKTTYIGLYLALEKPSKTEREDDEYPFYHSKSAWSASPAMMLNENNPVLESISSVWSAQDLMLKMTLVGNFFATYFMPIHLDLIHSTVENIVFTNAMKVMAGGMQAREDWVHCGGTFRCKSFTNGEYFYMQPVDAEVGPLTILGLKDASYNITSSSDSIGITNEPDTEGAPENCQNVLGYNLYLGDTLGNQDGALSPSVLPQEDEMDIRDLLFCSTNRYKAYGAPVRFDIEIQENVPSNDFIKAAQIHWRRNGTELFDYRDSGIFIEPVTDENGKLSYSFSFNILIEHEGKYDMSLIFESSRGLWYSNKFTINVLDDADNHISIYKITRGNTDQWKDSELLIDYAIEGLFIKNPSVDGFESDVNEFMFSSVEDYPDMQYAQFIHSSSLDFTKAVGMNHVLMIPLPVPNSGSVTLEYKGGSSSLALSGSTSVGALSSAFPNYMWAIKKTHIWMKNENTEEEFDSSYKGELSGTETKVVIGIRKYFTTEESQRILADKTYALNGDKYNVKITQSGELGLKVHVKCTTGPGETISYAPVSKKVEVDILGKHKAVIDVLPDCSSKPSNLNSNLGSDDYRIQVKGYSSRIVDEDRFVPLFHKLVPITSENWDLGPGESCIAIPHFTRTQQDKVDELTLYFTHCGTASRTDTKPGITNIDGSDGEPTKIGVRIKSFTNPAQSIIAEYRRRPLKRGFYDVTVRYKYNGSWHTEKQAGAFRIR